MEPPDLTTFSMATLWDKLDAWANGAIALIPNLVAASLLFLLFLPLAALAFWLVHGGFERTGRANLGEIIGSLAKWITLVFGFLLALSIVLPSFSPGNLIAGLGISSIAIGFAFKDILQNWLAGVLLLLRQPFEVGDQVEIGGYSGSVVEVQTRSTVIRTFDGHKVEIPNAEVYQNALEVSTSYEKRRSEYDIGIGYGDDIDKAKRVLREAVEPIEGVESDPGVDVLVWGIDASWITIRVRWWTLSRETNIVAVRSNVLQAIKEALDRAAIDMPYPTAVHLMHDQTEETDGDRSSQREGWPAPETGDLPAPRWKRINRRNGDAGQPDGERDGEAKESLRRAG